MKTPIECPHRLISIPLGVLRQCFKNPCGREYKRVSLACRSWVNFTCLWGQRRVHRVQHRPINSTKISRYAPKNNHAKHERWIWNIRIERGSKRKHKQIYNRTIGVSRELRHWHTFSRLRKGDLLYFTMTEESAKLILVLGINALLLELLGGSMVLRAKTPTGKGTNGHQVLHLQPVATFVMLSNHFWPLRSRSFSVHSDLTERFELAWLSFVQITVSFAFH